jgi:hypothetical protein
MQRSPLMVVLVECPHHGRAVRARRNLAIDRLVACEESDTCRLDTRPGAAFPQGCPVYPSLTAPTK